MKRIVATFAVSLEEEIEGGRQGGGEGWILQHYVCKPHAV